MDKYVRCEIELTEDIKTELKEHQELFVLIEEATKKPFCSIPIEYEKGVKYEMPNYIRLTTIEKIIAAQALYALENNRTEESLSLIFQGLIFGKHIISGAPLLINQLVGIVIMRYSLKILEIAISTGQFNKKQLHRISEFLSELEADLPMLSWACDGNFAMIKMSLANISFYKPMEFVLPEYFELEMPVSPFYIKLLCWRYFFSSRWAAIQAFRFFDKIVLSLEGEEKAFKGKNVKERRASYYLDVTEVRRHVNQNPIVALLMPNYGSMLRRKFEMISKIRMLNLCALIWLYHFQNNKFPESLQDIENDVVIEPYSGELWFYLPAQDSVAIVSPGANRSYGDDYDDIYIFLKKSSIKKYKIDTKSRKNPMIPKTSPGRRMPPRR